MSARSSMSTASSVIENQKFTCVLVETASGDFTGRRMLASEELVQHSEALQINSRSSASYAEFFVPQSDTYNFDHINVICDYLELRKSKGIGATPGRGDDLGRVLALPDWSKSFFEGVEKKSSETLMGATNLAAVLHVHVFVQDACVYVARRASTMSIGDLRRYLHEDNDFSSDEWANVRASSRLTGGNDE